MINIDDKDKQILELLKANSKLTSQQISKKTSIPITTIHNRIKKLESEGVITKYSITLNRKKTGKNIAAFIFIKVEYNQENNQTGIQGKTFSQESLAKKISSLPEVEEVCILTGETDILVKAAFEDVESLNDFIVKKLRNLQGIANTRTAVILSELI